MVHAPFHDPPRDDDPPGDNGGDGGEDPPEPPVPETREHDATIFLDPPFYGASCATQVMIFLHELGHATGRIWAGHSGSAPKAPTTERGMEHPDLRGVLYSRAARTVRRPHGGSARGKCL